MAEVFQEAMLLESVPDILLLAYQHSIPLSLSLPAQVHALHRHIE